MVSFNWLSYCSNSHAKYQTNYCYYFLKHYYFFLLVAGKRWEFGWVDNSSVVVGTTDCGSVVVVVVPGETEVLGVVGFTDDETTGWVVVVSAIELVEDEMSGMVVDVESGIVVVDWGVVVVDDVDTSVVVVL